MKKLLLLLAAVATLASCVQNIEGVDNSLGYTRITVGVPQNRTALGDKDANGTYKIVWSEEDAIVVNGAISTKCEIGEDKTSATFSFETAVLNYPYHLTYPYTEGSACTKDKPTVVFKAVQEYVEGTFGVGNAPMCGYTEKGGVQLKHLAGVLRFALTGETTLSTIEIIAGEEVALAGEFGVDCKEGTITPIEVGNKITYVANQLLSEVATPFYITLPKGVEGVCQVIFTDKAGLKMTSKWTANNIEAGVVREFKEFAFKGGASLELQEMTSIQDELEIEEPIAQAPANNEIWYTSTNGEIVTPNKTNVFGANIVSNTYENGKGVIKFDGDITSIGERAFYGRSSLTSITIPNSVTSIGGWAFDGCSSLTSVTIPDSVTSIGCAAFQGCDGLLSLTIPNSIASIGSYAFNGCSSLTSVTIPNSVTSIGDDAFSYCSSLTSVTIPDSVASIGEGVFCACSSLTAFYGKFASDDNRCLIVYGVLNSFAPAGLSEYTIPDSVTSIGEWAFSDCSSLTSVTIPNSVASIGEGAFCACSIYCPYLKEFYCRATTPPIGGYDMFYGIAPGSKIYVPRNSVDAYKSAKYWSDYADYIEGYDF